MSSTKPRKSHRIYITPFINCIWNIEYSLSKQWSTMGCLVVSINMYFYNCFVSVQFFLCALIVHSSLKQHYIQCIALLELHLARSKIFNTFFILYYMTLRFDLSRRKYFYFTFVCYCCILLKYIQRQQQYKHIVNQNKSQIEWILQNLGKVIVYI
jgi:hypothetical protein